MSGPSDAPGPTPAEAARLGARSSAPKGPAAKDKGNTKAVWIYDMRTNVPVFGKRTPLTRAHFDDFVTAYGGDVHGNSARTATDEEGRWRVYTRAEIAERGDNQDITWLRDDSIERAEDLPDPEDVAAEILGHLRVAMDGSGAALERRVAVLL